MIDRLNGLFDFILKLFSFVFFISILSGGLVLWVYLNKFGLEREITSLVGFTQILLMVSTYSFLVSINIISVFLIVPRIISYCRFSNELEWDSDPIKSYSVIVNYSVVFIFLLFFYICISMESINEYFPYLFFLVVIFLTCIFYHFYGGPKKVNFENKFKNFFVVFIAFAFAGILLVFSFLFLIKAVFFISPNESRQWFFLLLMFIIYSFFVSVASSYSNRIFYLPVFILSLFVVVFIFADRVVINIVSKLGVGAYKVSLVVERRSLLAIEFDENYKIEKTSDDSVLILRDVWVKLSLSDKYILSSTDISNDNYTIPKSAVLGEVNNRFLIN